jgi:hypothetical protein
MTYVPACLCGSHILPSMRLGFVPEPLATLLYGSRIAPESEQESGPQALTEHRRLSSQRVNDHAQDWVDDTVLQQPDGRPEVFRLS